MSSIQYLKVSLAYFVHKGIDNFREKDLLDLV